jgi:hypothetical protein
VIITTTSGTNIWFCRSSTKSSDGIQIKDTSHQVITTRPTLCPCSALPFWIVLTVLQSRMHMLPTVLAATLSFAASMSWTNPLGESLIGEVGARTLSSDDFSAPSTDGSGFSAFQKSLWTA